ncbi:hypothetical protein [Amycolatopsis japonica]|uniref:hypothetical protein n=1 Tax=Amycolatopsis japonica TaxID=208439 RepID=UPI00381F4BC1
MTSLWQRLEVEDKVREVLREGAAASRHVHHLGRPYVTVYQLAIRLHSKYPDVATELGFEVGGVGIGRHNSLAQYLARELSVRIREGGDDFPVEGAFLSNDRIAALTFVGTDGGHITSSLTDSGDPLSLFRLSATQP